MWDAKIQNKAEVKVDGPRILVSPRQFTPY